MKNKVFKEAFESLLKAIAQKHKKPRGDVVIAYETDNSVYAVRQWGARGNIPQEHRPVIAKLAGWTKEAVDNLHLTARKG